MMYILLLTSHASGLPPQWLTLSAADDGYAVADIHGNWFKVPNNWKVRIDGCDEPAGFVCEQSKTWHTYMKLPIKQELTTLVNVIGQTLVTRASGNIFCHQVQFCRKKLHVWFNFACWATLKRLFKSIKCNILLNLELWPVHTCFRSNYCGHLSPTLHAEHGAKWHGIGRWRHG